MNKKHRSRPRQFWISVLIVTFAIAPARAESSDESHAPAEESSKDTEKDPESFVKENFKKGEYNKARSFLMTLHGADPSDPWVSYSLGQCHRMLGDFTAARYFYSEAARAYDASEEPARAMSARKNAAITESNLTLVTIKLAAEYRSTLCDATLDGIRLRDSPQVELGELNPNRFGASARNKKGKAILGGYTPTMRANPAVSCEAYDIVLLLANTIDHELAFEWHVDRERPRRARIPIPRRLLKTAHRAFDLSRTPATFQLKSKGVSARDFQAFLQPISATSSASEIQIGNNRFSVAPGAYRIALNVDGQSVAKTHGWKPGTTLKGRFDARAGTGTEATNQVQLYPGEVHELPVDLKPGPSKVAWITLSIAGLLLITGVSYYLTEGREKDVDAGSLGWSIRVP